MRFLYSGANSYLAPQNSPIFSLGGFVSSSVVPNGRLNGLFSDGSYTTAKYGLVETKALILENESSSAVSGVTFGYQYSDEPDFFIEVAVVTLVNNQSMEKLGNSSDTPYYGNFIEANIDPAHSIDHSIDLGTLAAGGRLGIWIRRTQLMQTFVPVDFSIPIAKKVDAINFTINWTP